MLRITREPSGRHVGPSKVPSTRSGSQNGVKARRTAIGARRLDFGPARGTRLNRRRVQGPAGSLRLLLEEIGELLLRVLARRGFGRLAPEQRIQFGARVAGAFGSRARAGERPPAVV